ncbi:hypothetical protein WN55_07156 [Dufourea novaeangliae]|uniref:Protein TsetseEP domain-containing protein n=2 Tax=Dufourea novaeangliae TaxID=178035 RepID=A0A154P4M9_DUFNO|nr:hypothetical protein WN55_07156 [Dufourea novaeangliae]
MTNINNIVNPALSDIRAKVDAANAAGKDAEHCYTDAKANLRTASQTGFSELNRCEQNALQSLQPQFNALDTAEATGNKYITELDAVFLNCYSSDIFAMQTCIALKLGNINQSIRAYESTINSMKNDVQNAANRAVLAANSCNMDVVSTVRSSGTDVRITANRCTSN